MTISLIYSRSNFIECGWHFNVENEEHYGYSSIMQSLQKLAREKHESGLTNQAKVLELLARAASMMLTPSSINEPFSPSFQDFQSGRRSSLPDDFVAEELIFFEEILEDIIEPWLKARLADLLWLRKRPKNPRHARIAIDSYNSHAITSDTWNRGVSDCIERAARLCIQIKEFDTLTHIKTKLFSAFDSEYPNSKFMSLWIADAFSRLNIDGEYRNEIALALLNKGEILQQEKDYYAARAYFELAVIKNQQIDNINGWLACLTSIAVCFEKEADARSESSNMVANSFYENAMQAYRRIPAKYRDEYDINNKLKTIQSKITSSGQASLDELGLIKTPGIDISDIVEASKAHVAGKHTLEEALLYFTGVFQGTEYKTLVANAKEQLKHSFLSNLFASTNISSDGRVVAKTPPMNLSAGDDDPSNRLVLDQQIHQEFLFETQIVVEGNIMPSLRQMIMEHRVTKRFIEEICSHSPIVPEGRQALLGYALWLGFEYEFGQAIHLLCPQFEHIVRTQLKEAGAHTSNIDKDGIENENGLSTLMELPEATTVFGENLSFEIKSLFTESLGFNLRNEVAHGLLDDSSSITVGTIYAWWLILKLVIRSIVVGHLPKN